MMNLLKYYHFKQQFRSFKSMSNIDHRFKIAGKDKYPCLNDATTTTEFDRHYIYHLAWAVRILHDLKPNIHTDISSSLYFCTLLSAFIPVEFYDYRPADITLSGLKSGKADLLDLPFEDKSISSLSCMHVVEHIGLGRYGDSLNPLGDIKAMKELQRVIAPGGSLLFVVPVGKPKIFFNAHRVYEFAQILESFNELQLVQFALIPDEQRDGLIIGASFDMANQQEYGCGCFWFRRL